ncbi:hypothetical protein BGW39_007616, partial [Mortierella sp. 14UC]
THFVKFGKDMKDVTKEAAQLLRDLLHPEPLMRPTFRQVVQHRFFRDQEQARRRSQRQEDQQGEGSRKTKKKQKKAAEVTTTANDESQGEASGTTPDAIETTAAAVPITTELTAEELIAFLLTPSADLELQ